MGYNSCSENKCCFDCFYMRCFRVRRLFRKNKTAPDSRGKSHSPPTPSMTLTTPYIGHKERTEEDEQSIQDQLSLFHFGQKNSSGRRYSHPNQVVYVDEYERIKGISNPGSPSTPTLHADGSEFDWDEKHVNKFLKKDEMQQENEGGKNSPTTPVIL